MNYYSLIKPFLFMLPEEKAHELALFALEKGLLPSQPDKQTFGVLRTKIWGLDFKNPVGLSGGFDKNGVAIKTLLKQNFGFIEVGSVTPLPQAGNEKPRLFRLKEDEAIINRMGMNNKGADEMVKRLQNWQDHKKTFGAQGVVGINIAKNKDAADAVTDYLTVLRKIYGLSDYITVNISSPNTPGLRSLQGQQEMEQLVGSLQKEIKKLESGRKIPLLIKIAPDLSEDDQKDVAELALKMKFDGLVVGNTTLSRENLKSHKRDEQGGMSGKPLFDLSTKVLGNMYRLTSGKIPLVGVGGISSGEDAYRKIRAGASLLQIYSVLIYKGFSVVNEINKELSLLLMKDKFKNVSEAVGIDIK